MPIVVFRRRKSPCKQPDRDRLNHPQYERSGDYKAMQIEREEYEPKLDRRSNKDCRSAQESRGFALDFAPAFSDKNFGLGGQLGAAQAHLAADMRWRLRAATGSKEPVEEQNAGLHLVAAASACIVAAHRGGTGQHHQRCGVNVLRFGDGVEIKDMTRAAPQATNLASRLADRDLGHAGGDQITGLVIGDRFETVALLLGAREHKPGEGPARRIRGRALSDLQRAHFRPPETGHPPRPVQKKLTARA
jgi:hypothetical protein